MNIRLILVRPTVQYFVAIARSMHFKIYLRRFGKLIALQKISRTTGGIYFISPRSSSDYVSYHEDGKYWVRSRGKRFIKKLRQPLSNFVGLRRSHREYSTFGRRCQRTAMNRRHL